MRGAKLQKVITIPFLGCGGQKCQTWVVWSHFSKYKPDESNRKGWSSRKLKRMKEESVQPEVIEHFFSLCSMRVSSFLLLAFGFLFTGGLCWRTLTLDTSFPAQGSTLSTGYTYTIHWNQTDCDDLAIMIYNIANPYLLIHTLATVDASAGQWQWQLTPDDIPVIPGFPPNPSSWYNIALSTTDFPFMWENSDDFHIQSN
ncbi:hypothetical protein PAPYR_8453 [Paratrimastix pyriformis]|uniref:Uncharacterized protein n=1 Tax=Paratrimastix pyriformis TaxID=342808 RepID=A0ABQ8UC29_9EUKA|nr:hypothetical protein PAPYR_8453 [Paratrimastix pyriformis]